MTDTKTTVKMPVRLKVMYQTEIRKQLKEELKLANINEVPKLEKIVLNIGLGKAKDDKKAMEVATTTLKKISGQTPVQTLAKISVAGFKLREGNKIGLKVTLRGDKMYEFLDRLINIVLPRLRDFHGLSLKSFDKQGNYSIGIVDQTVFPEINFEDSPITHGLQAIIVTDSVEKEYCKLLLEKLGMPFEKELDNDKGKEN
ncbi:MAG TPA: 50S ribosomal protein L5 [Candidatus Saccharibacteria bacterium]|nr:50S ribosomal protein L5 [Candidatus Saccharibacteria bacterium]